MAILGVEYADMAVPIIVLTADAYLPLLIPRIIRYDRGRMKEKEGQLPLSFEKRRIWPKFFTRITKMLSENIPNTEQITIPGVTHDLGRMSKPDIH